MNRRAKPDSSYASNHLTRSNGPPRPLLSTFRNNDLKKDAPPKPEPATDDEPVSSSDENDETKADPESESDAEIKPRGSGETLEEKMAKSSPKSEQELPTPRSVKAPQKTKARESRKRASTGSAVQNQNNTDAELFEEFGSSRVSKRRKVVDYSSRANRQSDHHTRAPSPSQDSAKQATPRGNARKPKPKADKKAKKPPAKETEEAQKHEFKVPKGHDVDIPSPNSKTRSRPEFKAPPFLADASSSSFATSSAREPPTFDFDDEDDSPLSTPLSSASSTLMQQFADMDDEMLAMKDELEESEPKEGFFCPMCKQAVDPGLLMRFQAQPRQRIRDQQRFCESHKQQTAGTEWQHRGYPSIDWDKFDDRINGHFDYIDSLLVSESPSYYRNILDTTLKSGKAKNFRLTLSGDGLETICCGYYGSRGADKMCDTVLDNCLASYMKLMGSFLGYTRSPRVSLTNFVVSREVIL